MQFDSFLFLAFFTITLALYYAIRSWQQRKLLLLVASYLFYAAWSPPLVALVWISTVADFEIARRIAASGNQQVRKLLLCLSLGINLGLLGYFKYATFLVESFTDFAAQFGLIYQAPALDILLPIGISFYTFQTLSYTIDIYRRELEPSRSFLDFALFVTFFPQLVAGPIVRARNFLPQCTAPRPVSMEMIAWGFSLLLFGLGAKVVMADTIFAPVADAVFADPDAYRALDVWSATFAFSGQIFFDFAGYSLCAIGAALCLGFHLPDNFRSPYAAIGFSDFWTRWHISLSSWLRDYLYISLGGNRGRRLKTFRNLSATMLLGGLWHGASWNFVLWGGLHGLLLVAEHQLRRAGIMPKQGSAAVRAAAIAITFVIVTLVWIPFRAQGVDALAGMVAGLVRADAERELLMTARLQVLLGIIAMLGWHIYTREKHSEVRTAEFSAPARAAFVAICALAIAVCSTGDSRAFIYFQF